MRRAAIALTAAATLAGGAPAHAYKLDTRIVPQPKVQYHTALADWKTPLRRVARALNRAKVGVQLVEAQIAGQASIQIGRLNGTRCGYPGVNGTTQSIAGGYAAIYLPRGCNATQASIIAAHEIGHALGLKHEDRRCALLNSSGSGRLGVPSRCFTSGRRYDWLKHPFRADDLAGLKKLYRNTPPKVTLALRSPATTTVRALVSVEAKASDAQRNLSELRVDFGDGSAPQESADPAALSTSHQYTAPGTYTITATALDFYLKRATATVTVTVT